MRPAARERSAPLASVAVAGKSVQQATRMIQERLGARFLVNPQVSIAVIEPAKRLFTVLGQVQRPGTYRFPDRQSLDLMQVIGIAGGYTRLANPAKITVKRRVSGKESVFHVDGKRFTTDRDSEVKSRVKFHRVSGDGLTKVILNFRVVHDGAAGLVPAVEAVGI